MQQPTVCRTWAPRGQTPILYERCSHERLSVLSALVVSPQRQHLSLYFSCYPANIKADSIVSFLRWLRWQGVHRFILVLDRWSAHRAGQLTRFFEHSPCSVLAVEWLPAYSPELNPVEQVWNNAKHGELANYTPESIEALSERVNATLCALHAEQHLLRSFFATAELSL